MIPDPHSTSREATTKLSHRLRNALNSVVGVTGLLASTPLNEEQREYLATIKNGTDQLLELVGDLLETPDAATLAARESTGATESTSDAWAYQRNGEAPIEPPDRQRILLVEDNMINRKVITRLLEKLGHSVDTATNGREAVEAVEGSTFDLVFMDIQMPEVDGLEAMRRIRGGISPDRQPWIVALTAAVRSEDRAACAEAGANDHLGKPVRAEDLQHAIRRSIDEGSRAA